MNEIERLKSIDVNGAIAQAIREKQVRESGCVYCISCPEKITAKKERYSHATETGIAYDNIKVNFCPMCGRLLTEGEEK